MAGVLLLGDLAIPARIPRHGPDEGQYAHSSMQTLPSAKLRPETKPLESDMFKKYSKKSSAFTLVEIMFVVAIIALLAAIALPNFLRARKRSHASKILEDLRILDAAIEQYALDTSKSSESLVNFADLQKYLKLDSTLYHSNGKDTFGNNFGPNGDGTFAVDTIPLVSTTTYNNLSDVAPAEFWSPYH